MTACVSGLGICVYMCVNLPAHMHINILYSRLVDLFNYNLESLKRGKVQEMEKKKRYRLIVYL